LSCRVCRCGGIPVSEIPIVGSRNKTGIGYCNICRTAGRCRTRTELCNRCNLKGARSPVKIKSYPIVGIIIYYNNICLACSYCCRITLFTAAAAGPRTHPDRLTGSIPVVVVTRYLCSRTSGCDIVHSPIIFCRSLWIRCPFHCTGLTYSELIKNWLL
jgi:hypothetical protein